MGTTFEEAYQKLRRENLPGWGGEHFFRRMESWKGIVERCLSQPEFPRPGAEILELGCGSGDVAAMFAERGYRVAGVDLSATAIAWAQEKFLEKGLSGRFFAADVCRMNMFSGGSFDVVVDGNCFHCVLGDERTRFLREVHRVLRGDGVFLVEGMVGDPREMIEGAVFDPVIRAQVIDGVPFRYMPRPEVFEKEVTDAGFEILIRTLHRNDWWDQLELLCRKS